MIIKEVKYEDVINDVTDLTQEHWDEVGESGGSDKLKLDDPTYRLLSRLGKLVLFIAEYNEEIVGYVTYVLNSGIHSAHEVYASTDATFVKKDYRKSILGVGHRLLTHAEEILKDKYNVTVLEFGMNTNYDITNYLLKRGYQKSSVLFTKNIGD